MINLLRSLISTSIALRYKAITTENTIAIIVPYNNVVKELKLAILDSAAPGVAHTYAALSQTTHTELRSGDPRKVLQALTDQPWIIQHFVTICTAISSTGAQFLEVVYYKPALTAFTKAFPANIVATTRCISRLWIVCNPARCRGLLAIPAIYIATISNIFQVCVDGTPMAVLDRIGCAFSFSAMQTASTGTFPCAIPLFSGRCAMATMLMVST